MYRRWALLLSAYTSVMLSAAWFEVALLSPVETDTRWVLLFGGVWLLASAYVTTFLLEYGYPRVGLEPHDVVELRQEVWHILADPDRSGPSATDEFTDWIVDAYTSRTYKKRPRRASQALR
jgi:hypothetical protein